MVLIQMKVKEQEKVAFARAAELSGMKLATWIRVLARKAAEEELTARCEPVAFLTPLEQEVA